MKLKIKINQLKKSNFKKVTNLIGPYWRSVLPSTIEYKGQRVVVHYKVA